METQPRDIKDVAKDTLELTQPLVQGPNKYGSPFSPVIEGALRRDYSTLYAILRMYETDEEERQIFGGVCLDLARRVIEDFISIRYMLLNGKKKMAERFRDFYPIEVWKDVDFSREMGTELDPKMVEGFKKDYEKAKQRFGNDKNWAGKPVEEILELIARNDDSFTQRDLKLFQQTYLLGNYENHFCPTGIFRMIQKDLFEHSEKSHLELSLIVVTTLMNRLALIFAEEFDLDDRIKQHIAKLWEEVHGLPNGS